MQEISKSSIEKLYNELWDYWKSLWTFEQVSKDIFDLLEFPKNKEEIDHNIWVQNLVDIERFPWYNKVVSDNVLSHQFRLYFLVLEAYTFILNTINKSPSKFWLKKKIDLDYLKKIALSHDDVEWINPLKDIPTDIKMNLSENTKNILSLIEDKCINILSVHQKDHLRHTSSRELKFIYKDAEFKKTQEWQLLSFLDKLDWFCFCINELVNWNREFIKPFNNYISILKEIKNNKEKYNLIRWLIDSESFYLIDDFEKSIWQKAIDYVWRDLHSFEYITYTKIIRNIHSIDLFNIDSMIQLEDQIETLVSWVYKKDKSREYYELVNNDENVFTWMFAVPDIRTSRIFFYETWKIAFAKVRYDSWWWKIVNWIDEMYWKK